MSDADATVITLSDGVDEVTFYGTRPDPTTAFGGWEFSDLVDWRGQTERKGRGEDRPNGHGGFQDDQVWRASAAPSFNARFIGATMAETIQAIEALSAMGAEEPVTMTVVDPVRATTRLVTVVAVTTMDRRSRRFASVAVDLEAADPRRYARASDVPWVPTGPPSAGAGRVWPAVWPLIWPGGGSSGRIELVNTGRAPSAPIFRLHGGFSSAVITCAETGSRIGLDRPVPPGSVVEINTDDRERRATIDGQSDVSRWLRWREWEIVPPQQSRTFQFDVTDPVDSPTLEGRVLSAWW